MKPLKAWQLGLAAIVLMGAGTVIAAFQGRDTVCWLGTGDWQLREKDGNVYLVECHCDWSDALPEHKRYKWHVNAPTIKSQSGKYLAGDLEGHDHKVHLVGDKGANTRWVFEFVSTFRPQRSNKRGVRQEGQSGFAFRAKMAEGSLKGWYLAAEKVPSEQNERKKDDPITRRLKLVRDVKEATIFTYVDINYYEDHS